ncbi:MAG: 30S ribosomal protein S20 [Chloroflexota bacterium]
MANTKSAQKAWRQGQSRAVRNQAARSAVRTYVKKAAEAVGGTAEDAAIAVRAAVQALDRAAQRGIVHRNAAARRKSRLMARLHQLSTRPIEVVEVAAPPETKPERATRTPAKRATSARATGDKKPATPRKPVVRKPASPANT